jgi:hypothetical protein
MAGAGAQDGQHAASLPKQVSAAELRACLHVSAAHRTPRSLVPTTHARPLPRPRVRGGEGAPCAPPAAPTRPRRGGCPLRCGLFPLSRALVRRAGCRNVGAAPTYTSARGGDHDSCPPRTLPRSWGYA